MDLDKENIGLTCPVCRTPWTITNFGIRTWYDCIPCKKRAEDILEETPPEVPRWKYDDLLKEFEEMLG